MPSRATATPDRASAPGTAPTRCRPALTKRVEAIGLPKLYAPTEAGSLGGAIRFQARLSSPLAWSVSIVDANGKVVTTGRGKGATRRLDLAIGRRTEGRVHLDDLGAGIRVATGLIGKSAPPTAVPLSLHELARHSLR